MPIQPAAAGAGGTVEIFEEYQQGLQDLDAFSHIVLLYIFHRSKGFNLHLIPFMDTEVRELVATRAPKRLNPIGMSVVQLDRIAGCTLHVSNVDMLAGTPLLDIKPYVPDFDSHTDVRTGWLAQARKTVGGQPKARQKIQIGTRKTH